MGPLLTLADDLVCAFEQVVGVRVELLTLPRDELPGIGCLPEGYVAPRWMLASESEFAPDAAAQSSLQVPKESEPPPFVLFRRAHARVIPFARRSPAVART